MSDVIRARFTPEQVKTLNYFQASGAFHPFTCANQSDALHNYEQTDLVATWRGWICPYCDYTQDWAHAFMADIKAINSQLELRDILRR